MEIDLLNDTRKWLGTAYVCERYGISQITLWRWIKRGYFPAPIKTGPHNDTNTWTHEMLLKFEEQHTQVSTGV